MPRPFACKSWYGVFILVNKQRQLFAAFSNPDILAVNCNLNTLEFFYVVLLTKVIDSEGDNDRYIAGLIPITTAHIYLPEDCKREKSSELD